MGERELSMEKGGEKGELCGGCIIFDEKDAWFLEFPLTLTVIQSRMFSVWCTLREPVGSGVS